ncbi:MAG: helix-turn-helix domain-containing protein [Pseudomonadota bacterium]
MKPLEFSQPTESIPVFSSYQAGSVDAWIDTCATIFGIAPLNKDDARKDYNSASWFMDPITISNSHYYSMAAERRNWHINEAGAQIHVHPYAYSCASVESAGLPVECATGAITLLDYCRPFTSLHTDNECHSFFVPHDAINYRPSDAPHALAYSAHSQIGQLIGREMDNLLAQLKGGATMIAPADVRRFLGCIEVAMSPETASKSATAQFRESLKRAIQLFIEQRLDSPNLSATLILQNFAVSRASLYRLFDVEGGVRNYINHRRLVGAVTELAGTPRTRGQIHRVSERWGFSSDASFNRMVKREYGVTPGALFQMPVQFAETFTPSSGVQALMLDKARTRDMALV